VGIFSDTYDEFKKASPQEKVVIVGASVAALGIALYLHSKSTAAPNQPGANSAGIPANFQQGGGGGGGSTTPVPAATPTPVSTPVPAATPAPKPGAKPAPKPKPSVMVSHTTVTRTAARSTDKKKVVAAYHANRPGAAGPQHNAVKYVYHANRPGAAGPQHGALTQDQFNRQQTQRPIITQNRNIR
jgi:hypothetical protein